MSLEGAGDWDQFAANEQRFGVKTDYDETIYTTKIDRSGPLYRMRELEAERISREIVADTSTNAHLREERGLQHEDDGTEEEAKFVCPSNRFDQFSNSYYQPRYSGVHRNGQDYPPLLTNQPNKYTPPARRPAAMDPAIISAQIARPSSKPQEAAVVVGQSTAAKDPVETSEDTATEQDKADATSKDWPPKPALTLAPVKVASQKSGATENVETELLDSFRQFANNEKMRVQDSRRHRASADKAVKLNDLMKFAKNFKLLTPVPKDLVPILAKDKTKQEEIVKKAQKNAESASESPSKASNSLEGSSNRRVVSLSRESETSTTQPDPSPQSRARAAYPNQGSSSSKDRSQTSRPTTQTVQAGQGLLSHRLAETHRLHKVGMPTQVPNPLPIQDARNPPTRPAAYGNGFASPQKMSGVRRSPTSATSAKFNVNATAFKPNPNASMFQPTATASISSSPRTDANTRSISRATSPSAFFGTRRPLPSVDRPSILDHFNILIHLQKEAEEDSKSKDYASNGGIKPAYRTPPTWGPPKDTEGFKSYKDMFEPTRPVSSTNGPHQSPPMIPSLAHQHQLPLHLQSAPHGMPQVHTVQHIPHPSFAQPHHYPQSQPHYDDHYMRPSASSSSVYPAPSPRMQNTHLAYASPMGHHAQLAYGQAIPQYVMGPSGPQPATFRQFSGGSHVMAPQSGHLAAPMVVQQPSGSNFMGMPQPMAVPLNPQIGIYPGTAPPAYNGPSQPPSGYPSPGRGAPMMMHQGSHQGQHPPMYMTASQYGQPIYAQQAPNHSKFGLGRISD